MKKLLSLCLMILFLSTLIISCTSTDTSSKAQSEPKIQTVNLPKIIINSTQNGGSNDFVSTPVAKHVKEAQMSWHDYSNKDAPDPWYEVCTISAEDEEGNALLDKVAGQVKVRGNWTTNYSKKSLRIKFDKKQTMLGLNEGQKFKNWVLLACWKDASLLRDAVALKMFNTMFPEYYSSDSKLVEVYINNTYWGVYLLAEQQETKEGRVGITEPEKNYKGTDIGYLIEMDTYCVNEVENEQLWIDYIGAVKDYNGSSLSKKSLQSGYTIKSDIYDAAQKNFIQDYMNKLWKICYEAAYNNKYYRFDENYNLAEFTPEGKTDDEKAKNCISQIIDIKSLADMYIYNEIVCDPDLYLTSFFMDIDFGKDGDKLLRFEAPWDFDSTLGNKRHCADAKGMFAGVKGYDVNYSDFGHGNPWMFIFINSDWFKQLVKEEWEEARKTNPARIADDLIESYEAYPVSFENNRITWGNPSDDNELCPASKKAAKESQEAAASYLKNWINTRIKEVDSIINKL